LRYDPPPSELEGTLEQRADDTEEVVRKRFNEYEAKTKPVLGYYEERGLVSSIEGVGDLDEITQKIRDAIGG
jgi:adenylate kinase